MAASEGDPFLAGTWIPFPRIARLVLQSGRRETGAILAGNDTKVRARGEVKGFIPI
jgi:hypothetical protein